MKEDARLRECVTICSTTKARTGHNNALCSKRNMEQNKNYKNGKGANESPNTVPAKASDNGIRETYMMRYAKK
ncbi:Putrescine N-methyltransferase [Dirofilaria immitis]